MALYDALGENARNKNFPRPPDSNETALSLPAPEQKFAPTRLLSVWTLSPAQTSPPVRLGSKADRTDVLAPWETGPTRRNAPPGRPERQQRPGRRLWDGLHVERVAGIRE